jgi:lipase maturation factor 1
MPRRRRRRPAPERALAAPSARILAALRGPGDGSGPAVARLFHALLACNFLVAWLSLGAQIDVLVGRRGLLPAADLVAALRSSGTSFLDAPTLFTLVGASDFTLHAGIALGTALAVLALVGVAPRLAFALGTALYLSYAVVCRTFLSFQWDNLLLECGLLAALLPRDRRAPIRHLLVRALLFKLYWESGLAKWQSPLHDWHDGSAMTFYYETAPLPARLAWYAHHLPAWWHAFEGWFTLFFELVLALAIFAPRRPRLVALGVFTLFQIVDVATANYGFFCYLALALHALLLDERDVRAARAWAFGKAPRLRRIRAWQRWIAIRIHRITPRVHPTPQARRALSIGLATAYLGASFVEALGRFGSPALRADLADLRARYAPFRLVNTYHLFAAITRSRIEPEVQTFDGREWQTHDFVHKPGDVTRAPHLVAPHQPRVDFQAWFYGLSYRRGTPPWVTALLDRVCHDPQAIQGLFRDPLPRAPAEVRVAFFRYDFTSPEERRTTGAWWRRAPAGAMRPVHCGH